MKTAITIILCLVSFSFLAQIPFRYGLHDARWRCGPWDYVGSEISHVTSPPTITARNFTHLIAKNYTSLCDSAGNLRCYTNGKRIYNANDEVMENGYDFNVPDNFDGFGQEGGIQNNMVVPLPDKEDSLAFFLHKPIEGSALNYDWYGTTVNTVVAHFHLYYSIIDMKANDGLGKMIIKNEPLINDTIESGRTAMVRHANGRDWWMPVFEYASKRYYKVLVSPDGASVFGIGEVDSIAYPFAQGGGGNGMIGATFTPDGNYYIRSYDAPTGTKIFTDIFQFDRCTGTLTHLQRFMTNSIHPYALQQISPNSRFLYIWNQDRIFQFDLWAADIPASKVTIALYDGSFSDETQEATDFWVAYNAPDGKMYMTTRGNTEFLHVMQYPNRKGAACRFTPRAITFFGSNHFTANWSPNYRLGPLDGSSCDTLGLDNYPEAQYRWEANSNNAQKVFFEDNSILNPTTWSWDFGDGTATSQDTSPVHVFATAGMYEVCLTVSNENASDTYCETIPVGVTDSETPTQEGVKVWPNPMSDYLQVQLPPRSEAATLVLYDMLSKEMLRQLLATYFINKIGVGQLPSGTYLYEISTANMVVQSGKLVKI